MAFPFGIKAHFHQLSFLAELARFDNCQNVKMRAQAKFIGEVLLALRDDRADEITTNLRGKVRRSNPAHGSKFQKIGRSLLDVHAKKQGEFRGRAGGSLEGKGKGIKDMERRKAEG